MTKNRSLLIVALIAVVNALGYGIIIPVLYSYSKRFGLSDFENGLLFSLFSVCQLLSTPIIGSLSDRYGRRPLLILSLAGSAVSFFLMAVAPSAIFLFLARALDGLTAGNIPVASAVISDTTDQKNRARGFGIIGAAFGFGFIAGPAISAFASGYSLALPFVIAGFVAAAATVLTAFLLPETNTHKGEVARHHQHLDWKRLILALRDERVGASLTITLFYSIAFSIFIYAFQPFSTEVLFLSPRYISIIFTVFGVIGLFSQLVLIPMFTKHGHMRKTLIVSLIAVSASFIVFSQVRNLPQMIIASILLALSSSLVQPIVQTILSRETDAASQGSIMGLNTSYVSIGQIVGPLIGGGLALLSLRSPFLAGSVFITLCVFFSFRVVISPHEKETFFTPEEPRGNE